MKSGDKADLLSSKSDSNQQTKFENKSRNEFNSRPSPFQIEIENKNKNINVDCTSSNDMDNYMKLSNDGVSEEIFMVKRLDNETVKTQKLVSNFEIDVDTALSKLNEIRIQNRALEKSIDLKLKQSSTLTKYSNNIDKFISQASDFLEEMFNKFKCKWNNSKDSFGNDVSVEPTQQNILSNSTNAFISFLKINNIHDLVEGMNAIGHGGEGRVFRAFLINTGEPVVVKSYFMDCEQSSRIEYAMLVLCNNVRGVKKPIGLFQTSTNYYLLMEDDHKSIPLDVLAEKGILTENQIQHLFSQMVYILYDLRNKFIKHRDVKLDNFLLNTESGRLSIIDFGWAMYTALDQVLIDEVKRSGETLMGTFDYLPPEADSISGTIVSYDKATVFALGCILLELFFGYQGKVRNIIIKETLHGFINRMSNGKNRTITKGAISILDRCLRLNPKTRLSLDEVLLHPWVPSDKVDNSLFKNINKSNPNPGQSCNTSLPCNLNRKLSANSQ